MTRLHALNYGLLVLLVALTAYEVWMAPGNLVLGVACGAFITACAWWVGVSFGKLLNSERDSDSIYEREYRRLIALEKQRNPGLAPFIDQQTIAAGHGVIDAEG